MSASQHEVDALITRARELRSQTNATEADLIHAEALGRQAVDLQEKISGLKTVATAFAIWELGLTLGEPEGLRQSHSSLRSGGKIYEANNDRVDAALVRSHAARTYALKGDHETATRLSGDATTSLHNEHTALQGQLRTLQTEIREIKTQVDALIPAPKPAQQPVKILMPQEIRAALDDTIIGQDAAKQVLSVARLEAPDEVKPSRRTAGAGREE